MHDIRWIRDNAEALKDGLRKRGMQGLDVEETVAKLFALDDERREQIAAAQKFQEERNRLSKEIGAAMKAKDSERAEALKAEVAALKDAASGVEAAEKRAVEALEKRARSKSPTCRSTMCRRAGTRTTMSRFAASASRRTFQRAFSRKSISRSAKRSA